jgi:hypothetical protein
MDGILLEVHNRKEVCCPWSTVATISHILALKLTASLRLMSRSITSLFWILAWPSYVALAYPSLPPKCTLWFCLSSSHIAVVLWVLTCDHSILIVPLYRQILPNTYHGANSLLSHDVMISHVTSCTHPLQSIQENIIFHRANDRFNLEVLTKMGNVVLDFWTWECSFPFRAFDRVGPRRSSDEVQHKWSHEAQPDSTRYYVAHSRNEKLHERPRSFPPANYPDILLSPRSICPSSFLVLSLLS